MSNDLHKQIYDRMSLKETDELLEIWQKNDRFEWSDEAFDAINEILKERDVKIPEQGEPVYERVEDETNREDYKFSDEELKIIDDENPPAFYNPIEVLQLVKWIERSMKVIVIVIALYNLVRFPTFMDIVRPFFFENPNSFAVYFIAFVAIALNALIGIAITNLMLKTLSHLLKILMEMEFRSRKGIKSNSVVE